MNPRLAPAAICGHTTRSSRYVWTCIRPPHDWDEDSVRVLEGRRRQGKVSNPDRHVMVRSATR